MTNQNESTGPDRRHEQPQRSQYFDSYPQVSLEAFEEHMQWLAAARTALEAALDARLRGWDLPHSPAIDELIASMPPQNQIGLIGRNLGFASKHEELVADHRAALVTCSAAMAAADHVVERFLRTPSFSDPAEFHVAALALEQALTDLQTAFAK